MPFRIAESQTYLRQIGPLLNAYPRLARAVRGIQLALAANPTDAKFPIMFVDYKIRCAKTGLWPDMPELALFFKVEPTRNEVILQWVSLASEFDDPD